MKTLDERRHELNGRCLTKPEAEHLASMFSAPMGWLLDLMQNYPLIGMEFGLTLEQDLSGFGAGLIWNVPDDIIEESREFYPGIPALPLGYVPVGSCVLGSGDPYFLKVSFDDPPLVRIPHERLEPDLSLSESVIEIVRPRLSDFFRVARFGSA
jgi:hypothetical protein